MKRIQYILITAATLFLTGCGGHHDPIIQQEEHPIEFGVSADLAVTSKTTTSSDAPEIESFTVLGGLTVDEYATNEVFAAGTEVTYTADGWDYSPIRYWQTGSYTFAGVHPHGIANASLASDDHNQLTLDFGTDGFNLSESQTDLMVAFDQVTVEKPSAAGPVEFTFDHQFSMVVIEGASKETSTDNIRIDEIKLYGNSAKTDGNMVFTYNASENKYTSAYGLDGTTTKDNVYQTISRPADEDLTDAEATEDWQLVSPNGDLVYDTLVPELLVFPEECTFTIVVKFTKDSNTRTMVGTLPAEWEAGKKYTYRFTIASDISFSVEVAPWGDPINVGDEIPII